MSLDLIAAFAAGYFLGAVPTAAWLARALGRDIFATGSGNMGAMNTARNLAPWAGAVVFLVDVGKGAAAATLGGWMGGAAGTAALPAALAAGVGAVAGHAWSPYVGFRGGKGLATAFGAMLPVAPPAALFAALLLVALVLLLRGRSELATALALLLYPVVAGAALLRAGWEPERAFAVVTGAALAALVSLAKAARLARARRRA